MCVSLYYLPTIILFKFCVGHINQKNSKVGYWISIVSVVLGAIVLSFLRVSDSDAVLHNMTDNKQKSKAISHYQGKLIMNDFNSAGSESVNFSRKVGRYLESSGNSNSFKKITSSNYPQQWLSLSEPDLLTSCNKQPLKLSRQDTWHGTAAVMTCSSEIRSLQSKEMLLNEC